MKARNLYKIKHTVQKHPETTKWAFIGDIIEALLKNILLLNVKFAWTQTLKS